MKKRTFARIKDFLKIFDKDYIIVIVKVTNVSSNPVKKEWYKSYKPLITMVDDKQNQYSKVGLVYEPQLIEGAASGKITLFPGVISTFVFIYDKFNNYTPKTLTVFIGDELFEEMIY